MKNWGVEGQPFPWSVDAFRPTSGGAVADVRLTEAATVALLDAAVHVARLVDGSNPRLMVPAAVESVRITNDLVDLQGSVQIRRLDGNPGEIVVDIVAKAPDGTTCVDIRSLRYADVESGGAQAPDRQADPRSVAHAIEWRPWRPDGNAAAAQPDTLAVVGGAGGARGDLHSRFADAGYRAAELNEARYVLYLAEAEPTETDIDAAVRLSIEVGDLVRLLADRDAQHPATLWIVTRGVREAANAAALPQSCLWGLARVIAVEQPDLYGGLVDISADGESSDAATALATLFRVPARHPSRSWPCATANSSHPPWCRLPGNRCESRCGVVSTRHI